MKYTYYGHSTFLLELDNARILFDPFISPNGLAKGIDINSIKCDYILLSHGHFDHVTDVEVIAKNNDATIVAAYELAAYYGAKNFKHHPMNIGGRWDFGTFSVKVVSAAHSSVLPDGTYSGNPVGFIINEGTKSIYYSGDTGLHMDMQLIGSYHKLDRAFLCIGDNFTMGMRMTPSLQRILSNAIKSQECTFDTIPYIVIDHE
jgi:L-ascorbate metabolism protein UlaG (beta-lactamase superfamily)